MTKWRHKRDGASAGTASRLTPYTPPSRQTPPRQRGFLLSYGQEKSSRPR